MERKLVDAQDRETLLELLDALANGKVPKDTWPQWQAFRQAFLQRLPLEEWVGRQIKDVFGSVYSGWRLLGEATLKQPNQPQIRLFNPNLEEDGWLCPHTVLWVRQHDMPFLVDSIRIELNRRDIAIHQIKSTRFCVRQSGQAQLRSLVPAEQVDITSKEAQESCREALIYMELRLLTDAEVLADIKASLAEVLEQVHYVVKDFRPLLAQTEAVAGQLARVSQAPLQDRVAESQAFLSWLADNHFTFMGYTEYDLVAEGEQKWLRENPDKRLGLFQLEADRAVRKPLDEDYAGSLQFHLSPKLIAFSKAPERSHVHRRAYSDYVVVKRFDEAGRFCGEARFLGLYTSVVYTVSPYQIPMLRDKVAQVFERSGLDPASHDGKDLRQILETFPRDELFQSSSSELYETVMGVLRINERYRVRLFMRPDAFGKFINCLIYVPRDLFNTRVRLRMQQLLGRALGSQEVDFNTYFSESILARVHLVFRIDPGRPPSYDVRRLENEVIELTRSWEDRLLEALTEAEGEERAIDLLEQYQEAFPSAYREHFDARTAVQDIEHIAGLDDRSLALSFYRLPDGEQSNLRFKVFRCEHPMELSDVIPVLENLGLRVVSEHPYEIRLASGRSVWLHNFNLTYALPGTIALSAVKQAFQHAFAAIWEGKAESDPFNRLVLGAGLDWRQVVVVRAFARYMRQTLFNFTEDYIAAALVAHLDITRNLVAFFEARFDPSLSGGFEARQALIEERRQAIITALDQVQNLNEDRIIRRFLVLMEGCVRSNFYQRTSQGKPKGYLALKFTPRRIPDIPEPRPLYEIFVYSPRVEAVHLRAGLVARGGLRWSDRLQDYRTEVLGLVKAQQVKNALIVPNGAKGGFVCKQLPDAGDRDAFQREGIECYRIFIRGMLDLTDNLVADKVQPPKQLVRLDSDDPYLVVAADKGTATFSDIANEVSQKYHHWLGDAFASGGSQGYDHKAMGITARGAWVAVQRHFRELGLDTQSEDFTVVGIGDMGGDVFGNGMLLSKHIRLVAAFNHKHIFIDPNPDAAASFKERQRLFNTPGSDWSDYDAKLISEGGGVFSREAKSVEITSAMRERFDIEAKNLTPNDLINALLKAPVDLLWNGGIGTYVKASDEGHTRVGDKANDGLRVDGRELRCRVVGEGGNLGMTQRGRVEYALNGGACNTDFIDNAAGVDCSDHEVNIKILLNALIESGDLTEKQRNERLASMTDQVAGLVLHNSYRQTQAISLAASDALARSAEYRRVRSVWQSQGRLDSKLEALPDDETLTERQAQGQALTRPELAVLISYAKVILKNDLAEANLHEDAYLAGFAHRAFPEPIRRDYPEWIDRHKLRRELVATQVANELVNTMGLSFAQRLLDSTGGDLGAVAKAYVIARDIYQLDNTWRDLEALDNKVDPEVQMELMKALMRRVRRAARWFLRNRRRQLDVESEVAQFAPRVQEALELTPEHLRGQALLEWQEKTEHLQAAGVPADMILRVASPGHLFSGLSVAEAARHTEVPLAQLNDLYMQLNDHLSLHQFARQVSDARVENYWQAMARETYLDDLEAQLRNLTLALSHRLATADAANIVAQWDQKIQAHTQRWHTMMNEVQNSSGTDYAIFSVALRELLDLVQITQHTDL